MQIAQCGRVIFLCVGTFKVKTFPDYFVKFKDFEDLEFGQIKFKAFQDLQGPVRTLIHNTYIYIYIYKYIHAWALVRMDIHSM